MKYDIPSISYFSTRKNKIISIKYSTNINGGVIAIKLRGFRDKVCLTDQAFSNYSTSLHFTFLGFTILTQFHVSNEKGSWCITFDIL